uniref:Trehalose transporter n=1 Tax=Leptinotarsa decemlineata TaxID=7539 RepID=A0A1W5YLJ3_LEPDE|nr:trehalose transporter [Leptinotarsa decemlineata]
MSKDNNIRMAIQEIEPLQKKQEEQQPNETGEVSKSSFSQIKTQLLAVFSVSLISLVIGYSTAYTAPAQLSLERDFNLTAKGGEMSWISSFMPLGALAGGVIGGTMIDYFGRKWTFLLTNIFFLVAWLISFSAQTYIYLYVGRIITGIAVGITSLAVPVYTAEIIQPEVRGTLGLLPTAMGNIGILVCFLFGSFLEWRNLALIAVMLTVPFLIMIWFIPDTPKFLLSKGQHDQAKDALKWLRGNNTNIDTEFLDLQKIQKKSDDQNESMMIIFSASNLKPLGIVLGLMLFQQFSGINAILFYTTKIFKESVSSLDENVCTVIVGVVNFVSTFVATILIDKLGRKILLYISSVTMIVSLVVAGAYFYIKNVTDINVTPLGWLPLATFMMYVLGFSLGFGPIPWLMMGEILPAKIRGAGASISTAFNWACTFIVTKTFLLIMNAIGAHYTFWMYGVVVVGALIFSIFIVPETKGKSLAEIENKLGGHKDERKHFIDNLKTVSSVS